MSDLLTRAAIRSDARAMAEVINPIILAGGTTAFEDALTEQDMTKLVFDRPQLVSCFVAEDQCGLAGFQYLMHEKPCSAGIATFARLSPKRRGVGTALFAETLRAANDAGLLYIDAKIRADNVGGLAYYGRMGFQDHSVIPGVPLRNGTPVDRVIKRRTL